MWCDTKRSNNNSNEKNYTKTEKLKSERSPSRLAKSNKTLNGRANNCDENKSDA